MPVRIKMNESLRYKHKVGVIQINEARYPKEAPYQPSINYPEYPFSGYISNEANPVYDGIRQLFFRLRFDIEHWNTPEWNPFGNLIKPGMTVAIKPNFVLSKHADGKDVFSIITHPSILRAILDYCWIALKGKGKIIIADVPHYNCNFQELLQVTKLEEIKKFFNKFTGPKIEIYDLRTYCYRPNYSPFCLYRLPADPQGSIFVNLSKRSAFYNHSSPKKLHGCIFSHRKATIYHHSGERQVYEISRTILNADVIIFVPKMKVHKKVGVTLNLKGLVGICTNKDMAIHYTLGSPSEGGDQFPEDLFNKKERVVINFLRWMFERRIYGHILAKHNKRYEFIHRFFYRFLFQKIIGYLRLRIPEEKMLLAAGNWHGNDSCWRMVADLAKIIHFVDKEGRLWNKPQRKLFSIIDGVIGGENKGPDIPDPKPAGVLIGGNNLLAVDIITTRLMGFDPLKLKQFSLLLNDSYYDFGLKTLDEIEVISDNPAIQRCHKNKIDSFFAFRPYIGWIGHIEI